MSSFSRIYMYIVDKYQWLMKWVVVDMKRLGKYMPSMNDRSIFEIPAFLFCPSGKKILSLFTLFLYHIWYSGYDINLYVTTNILDIPYWSMFFLQYHHLYQYRAVVHKSEEIDESPKWRIIYIGYQNPGIWKYHIEMSLRQIEENSYSTSMTNSFTNTPDFWYPIDPSLCKQSDDKS